MVPCRHYIKRPWRPQSSRQAVYWLLLMSWMTIALPARGWAEIDFDTEIMPILSRYGCNTAACHGGAAGRGGLHLSLFGGDPAGDYDRLVHAEEGRRVNLAQPATSLMLLKPTMQLDHGGEQRFEVGSPTYEILREWIAAGAARQRLRRLTSLVVTPNSFTPETLPATTGLTVVANFDDGTSRDVTSLAVYSSTDPPSLAVDPNGRIEVKQGGVHGVVVQFLSQTEVVSIVAPIRVAEPPPLPLDADNLIDRHVNARLRELRLAPTPHCDDATYLRRVSLDLTGRLPDPSEVREFLADSNADKRARLVDRLLYSAAYETYWTYQLGRLLRLHAPGGDTVATTTFQRWLATQVREDVGWRELVTALLRAKGDSHTVGPALFYRLCSDPHAQTEYVTEVFLGLQMRCANCHNHPLDRWTQDDYHGLAQVFAGVRHERVVTWTDAGKVLHPNTGKPAIARIPLLGVVGDDAYPIDAFAAWTVQADNPYFARAFVGRVWRAMMGQGIVDPPDDLRDSNPPTHPELLRELADHCVEHDYRLRPLLRVICRSDAYARSIRPGVRQASDARYYAAAMTRPLDAVILADAIADVTGIGFDTIAPQRFQELADVDRAAAALEPLGGCSAVLAEAAQPSKQSLAGELQLLNGDLLNKRVSDPRGVLGQMISSGATDRDILQHFYLHAYSREPSRREYAWWTEQLQAIAADSPSARRELLEDVVWSLLTSSEFQTNH